MCLRVHACRLLLVIVLMLWLMVCVFCCCAACRAVFVECEGVELMHLLLKGKKSSRYGAIKAIDFATTRCGVELCILVCRTCDLSAPDLHASSLPANSKSCV
jgi:hypothetical protein